MGVDYIYVNHDRQECKRVFGVMKGILDEALGDEPEDHQGSPRAVRHRGEAAGILVGRDLDPPARVGCPPPGR